MKKIILVFLAFLLCVSIYYRFELYGFNDFTDNSDKLYSMNQKLKINTDRRILTESSNVLFQSNDNINFALSLKYLLIKDNEYQLNACVFIDMAENCFSLMNSPIINSYNVDISLKNKHHLEILLNNDNVLNVSSKKINLRMNPSDITSGVHINKYTYIESSEYTTFKLSKLGHLLNVNLVGDTVFLLSYSLFALFLLIYLFAISGNYISRKVFNLSLNHNNTLKIGASITVGLTTFISIFFVVASIFKNATAGFVFSLLIIIILTFMNIRKNKDYVLDLKHVGIFLALIVIFFALYMSEFQNSFPNIWGMNGSLHSGRYTNIAVFIFENNFIPKINQNFGQSLLTVSMLYLGSLNPFFILFLFLALSKIVFAYTVYGLLNIYTTRKSYLIFLTALIFCYQPVLSSMYQLVWDSGSPILFNGYTDSLLSLITSIYFLFFFFNSSDKKRNLVSTAILTSVFSFYWIIGCPQILLINIVIISLLLLVRLIKHLKINNITSYLFIPKKSELGLAIFIMLISIAFSNIYGGMLLSKKITTVVIPGMMNISSFKLFSEMGFKYYKLPMFVGQFTGNPDFSKILVGVNDINGFIRNLYEFIYNLELSVWNSIRITFFSWISILIGIIYIIKRKKIGTIEEQKINFIIIYSSLFFVIGYCVAFFVIGNSWEMSRFLYPGYILLFLSTSIILLRTGVIQKLYVKIILSILFLQYLTFVIYNHNLNFLGQLLSAQSLLNFYGFVRW